MRKTIAIAREFIVGFLTGVGVTVLIFLGLFALTSLIQFAKAAIPDDFQRLFVFFALVIGTALGVDRVTRQRLGLW